jgi:tetratricopeptide (TPR) repeat protein
LWRAAQRYGDLHDMIIEYGDKPLTMLKVRHLSDAAGLFADVLDYQSETGKGNRHRRPDPLRFSFVFLKRGFRPGRVEFTVARGQDQVEAALTLRRDRLHLPENISHLRVYDAIRYELSNTTRNSAMTLTNHQRLEDLKNRLEETALMAIAAGDHAAAARMYVRLAFTPQLTFSEGRICGFSQARPGSELTEKARARAFALDPSNLYLVMKRYHREVKLLDRSSREERLQKRLSMVQQMIEEHGEKIWPLYYEIRAMCYADLGEFETASRLYAQGEELEPRFMDWSGEVADMKKRAELRAKRDPENVALRAT